MENIELIKQIDKILILDSVKKRESIKKDINKIKQRLEDDTFRIAVVGEFSSGKSTFINAMIGSDILTHAVNETTATVTYIYNVKDFDERKNTCEVTYNNGKKIYLDDMSKLMYYTTAQSEHNVAENICSVSVYVNFLNTDHQLLVVDTPGLNGIADRHREITIEEVKKAHACIYLLSMKGLTNSDVDFIKILQTHQSRFIFVQNFIDNLRISEGETVDKKIEDDIENIKKTLCGYSYDFKYNIYGISALKALAAKDENIKRLYSSDSMDISDRKKLYQESNICELESFIEDVINTGEYREYIVSSVLQALINIIDNIIDELEINRKINNELRSNSDKAQRIERAQKAVEKLKLKAPERKNRLDNFVISRDVENRAALKEYLKEQLKLLFDFASDHIDTQIQHYDDIDILESRIGRTFQDYISVFVTNRINTYISPELNRRISDNFDHLYDEAAMRITNFTSEIADGNAKIIFNIKSENENVEIEDYNRQRKINEYKIEVDQEKEEYEKRLKNWKENYYEIERKSLELNRENNKKIQIESQYERDIKALGKMPEREKKYITKTRSVDRKGFLGGLRTTLFGQVEETYTECYFDNSAQKKWQEDRRRIDERKNRDIKECDIKIESYRRKKTQLEIQQTENMYEQRKLKSKIEQLNKLIINEQSIYDEILNNNKREAVENLKKMTKEDLYKQLFDTDDCVLKRLSAHIDSVSKNNLQDICQRIMEMFDYSLKSRIDNLNAMISENEEKLNHMFEINEFDINALNEIKKEILIFEEDL